MLVHHLRQHLSLLGLVSAAGLVVFTCSRADDEPTPQVPVADLIKKMKDPDARVRGEGVHTLANQVIRLRAKGNENPELDAAIPVLTELLTDGNDFIRWNAARGLGGFGVKAKDAVPALIKAVENKNVWAAYALGYVGPEAKAAVPTLLAALDDTTTPPVSANVLSVSSGKVAKLNMRYFAAQSLGGIGSDAKAALPKLCKMAQEDKDELVRRSVVVALPRIAVDDKSIISPLVAGLKDASEEVRTAAVKSVGRVGGPALQPVVDVLQNGPPPGRAAAADALAEIGPEAKSAVPDLAKALRDEERAVRLGAAAAIGSLGLGAKDALPDLAAYLTREDKRATLKAEVEERAKAAAVLAGLGKAAVPALREALKDARQTVRVAAVEALGKVGPDAKDALAELTEGLRDNSASVRVGAATALGLIGPDAVAATPALKALLQDRNKDVREAAAFALERIGGK